MKARRRRLFLWTDSFAVLGLLILAVWLPAYYAQSDDARGAVGEGGFTLPPARIGDRVVYALIAQWQDEDPVMVDPVAEVRFRAPLPGESPYEAWIVEEWIRYPQYIDLGFATFFSVENSQKNYYDELDRKVWQRTDSINQRIPEWGHGATATMGASHPDHPVSGRSIDSGLNLRSHENPVEPLFELRYLLPHGDGDPYDPYVPPPRVKYIHTVATPESGPIYGGKHTGPMSAALFEREPKITAGDYRFAIMPDGQASIRLNDAQEFYIIQFKEGYRTERGEESWSSYRPDLPVAAGAHMRIIDFHGANILTLDIIPMHIEHGSGRGLHPPEFQPFGETLGRKAPIEEDALRVWGGERPHDPNVERVQLGDLHRDGAPLLRSVSLADVWATLQDPAATQSVRALTEGGHIAAFLYHEDGIEAQEEAPPPLGLPLPGLPAPEDPTRYRTQWFVAIANGNTTRVAAISIVDTHDGGIESVVVRDACGTKPHNVFRHVVAIQCGTLDSDRLDPARTVVSPHAVLEKARGDDPGLTPMHGCNGRDAPTGATPCAFAWIGVHACEDIRHRADCSQSPLLAGWPTHTREFSDARARSQLHDGYAVWNTTKMQATYNLGSGMPLRLATSEDIPQEDLVPTTAAPGFPVEYEKATPPTLAYAGIFLILASAVIRAMVWLASGGTTGAFAALYARITRQEVLSHRRRDEIIDLLTVEPGLTLAEISKRLETPRTPTLHHLETLCRTGLLVAERNGRRRHWFLPAGTKIQRLRAALERDPETAAFLAAVAAHPGAALFEITRLTGQTKPQASRMASRLEHLGVIRRERKGRRLAIRLVEATPRVAEAARETEPIAA